MYQSIPKPPILLPPGIPQAFDWSFAPYNGEFDPKWGLPSQKFHSHSKTLFSITSKRILLVCLFVLSFSMCSQVLIYNYLFANAKGEIKLKVRVLPTKRSLDYRLFTCKSSKTRFQFWIGNLKFMDGWSSTLCDWLWRTCFCGDIWFPAQIVCLREKYTYPGQPRYSISWKGTEFLEFHRVSIYLFIYLPILLIQDFPLQLG